MNELKPETPMSAQERAQIEAEDIKKLDKLLDTVRECSPRHHDLHMFTGRTFFEFRFPLAS